MVYTSSSCLTHLTTIGVNTDELWELRERKQKYLEKSLEKNEEPMESFFDFVGRSQDGWMNSGKTVCHIPGINDFLEDAFMVVVTAATSFG